MKRGEGRRKVRKKEERGSGFRKREQDEVQRVGESRGSIRGVRTPDGSVERTKKGTVD